MRLTTSALATFASLALPSAPLAQTYTIVDLGTLSATPEDGVRAADINNRGHVHGENDKSDPFGGGVQWRSFLWDGTAQQEIFPLTSGSTWSGGLNDADQCVGKFTLGGLLAMHGYFWDGGPIEDRTVGQRNFTHQMDINYAGNSTGTYLSEEVWQYRYQYHAFVMNSAGEWRDVGTLGGHESFARALNDRSHAVGYTRDAENHHLGYLWTFAGGMSDIGHLGGTYCDPEEINNLDQIVGASANEVGEHRPFLWQGGVMSELATLGGSTGRARGINDFGVVVGTTTDATETQRATIWNSGVASDLNELIEPGSGWDLTGARAINQLGEITRTGSLNGKQRAYRLNPILDAPRISGLRPGFADRDNRIFGFGFTPGAVVDLYYGFDLGVTPLACGEDLGIAAARLFATATADDEGRIEIDLWLPATAKGRAPFLQAAEPAACIIGELLSLQIR